METAKKILDTTKRIKANCERMVNDTILTSTPFIIGRDNLFLKHVGLVNGKMTGDVSITNDPSQAHQFSEANAKIVAANVENGNGTFEYYGVIDACNAKIYECNDVIRMMEEILESDTE